MRTLVKVILTLAPFLYMALIWVLSSHPADAVVALPSSSVDRFIKESLHLVEFAILYVLFVLMVLCYRPLTMAINIMLAVVACLYGLTDEIHQSFVPSRSATVIDFVKDCIGVCVCYGMVYASYFRGYVKGLERLLSRFQNWMAS